MARFLHPDSERARAALADIGVQFTDADPQDGSIHEKHLADFLPVDERQVRVTLVAEPPEPSERDAGMGAWHINNAQEAHSILDGEGIMQFQAADEVISVHISAGDAMLIDGAEHRYLPLTTQTWLIRHGGEENFAFHPRETGSAPVTWPEP